jgi:hypothetical protein
MAFGYSFEIRGCCQLLVGFVFFRGCTGTKGFTGYPSNLKAGYLIRQYGIRDIRLNNYRMFLVRKSNPFIQCVPVPVRYVLQ